MPLDHLLILFLLAEIVFPFWSLRLLPVVIVKQYFLDIVVAIPRYLSSGSQQESVVLPLPLPELPPLIQSASKDSLMMAMAQIPSELIQEQGSADCSATGSTSSRLAEGWSVAGRIPRCHWHARLGNANGSFQGA